MNIAVYSKSGCPQCVFTKKYLEAHSIDYEEKKIDENEQYREELLALGYMTLPVVTVGETESFSGYQPNKLQNLVSQWQK